MSTPPPDDNPLPETSGQGAAPAEAIRKRLFIVGCSRSGTTLLQVSVAAHARIQSFPETFFFYHVVGRWGRVPPWLGLPSGTERAALRHVLREVGRPDLASLIPARVWRLRAAADVYVRILDRIAAEAGKDVWLEKTPLHVLRLRLIERYVPRAHVVHILRDGRDVVASIYDRAQKFPEEFPKQTDPAYGIDLWNRCLGASQRYEGRPGHTFVLYEQLVERPEQVMRHVCDAAGLAYEPSMAAGGDAEDVVPERRPWIQQAKEPPAPRPAKFDRLFGDEQQRQIARQLDLRAYEELKAAVALEL